MSYSEKYDNEVTSALKLKKMYIGNAGITRGENVDTNLNISIKHKVANIETDKYKVELIINITNKDNSLNVDVTMIGIFVSKNNDLIEQNAISIMFPYLRSYISILTTQPGLQPIVLQPINVLSLLNKS